MFTYKSSAIIVLQGQGYGYNLIFHKTGRTSASLAGHSANLAKKTCF